MTQVDPFNPAYCCTWYACTARSPSPPCVSPLARLSSRGRLPVSHNTKHVGRRLFHQLISYLAVASHRNIFHREQKRVKQLPMPSGLAARTASAAAPVRPRRTARTRSPFSRALPGSARPHAHLDVEYLRQAEGVDVFLGNLVLSNLRPRFVRATQGESFAGNSTEHTPEMDKYTCLRESHPGADERSSERLAYYSDHLTWLQVVGGIYKGWVYSLGSQAYAYEGQTFDGCSFSASSQELLYSQQVAALTIEADQVRKS
ncbi:hypothetical protein M5K25_022415 [Dendrobium thyrsiflorum]|uniref:Uncharacterized protein n=1 Tax=Dendrobium thyrsiflorum TaxID=117978 RepID=A0ABD0UCD4_DENTH